MEQRRERWRRGIPRREAPASDWLGILAALGLLMAYGYALHLWTSRTPFSGLTPRVGDDDPVVQHLNKLIRKEAAAREAEEAQRETPTSHPDTSPASSSSSRTSEDGPSSLPTIVASPDAESPSTPDLLIAVPTTEEGKEGRGTSTASTDVDEDQASTDEKPSRVTKKEEPTTAETATIPMDKNTLEPTETVADTTDSSFKTGEGEGASSGTASSASSSKMTTTATDDSSGESSNSDDRKGTMSPTTHSQTVSDVSSPVPESSNGASTTTPLKERHDMTDAESSTANTMTSTSTQSPTTATTKSRPLIGTIDIGSARRIEVPYEGVNGAGYKAAGGLSVTTNVNPHCRMDIELVMEDYTRRIFTVDNRLKADVKVVVVDLTKVLRFDLVTGWCV